MKKILLALTLYFGLAQITAQTFNGSLEFKYSTQKDTSKNIYFIKDKMVKLDNYSAKSGNLEGSFIFDMTNKSIKWTNVKRKVWGMHKSETPPIVNGTCVVTKGGTKKIQGVSCTEYTVKNVEENTIITYWIATDKFTFFSPMIKMWNRKDKQTIYFTKINDLPEGSMPLLSEEKQISDGKSVTKLEVVKIGRAEPEATAFDIPANFTKFDQ